MADMNTTNAPSAPAAPIDVPVLLWSKRDVRKALGVSLRTFDRLCSSGRFAAPDVRIGSLRKWKPETVRKWIDAQAKKKTTGTR